MGRIFITVANFLGLAGLFICAGSGLARMMGFFQVGGYESMTLFSVGTGIMVASMLIKQELILWKTHHSTN